MDGDRGVMGSRARVALLPALLLAASAAGCMGSRQDDLESRTRREMDEAWGNMEGKGARGRAARERTPGSPVNIMVTVQKLSVSEEQAAAFGVAWGYADEHVRVRGGNPMGGAGFRMGYLTKKFDAVVQAVETKAKRVERTSQSLTTLSGYEGQLAIGTSRWIQRFSYQGAFYGGTVLERGFVGTQLAVKPTIVAGGPAGEPEQIEVSLTPVFTGLTGPEKDLTMTALTTRAIVPDGGSLVIGAQEQESSQTAMSFFRWVSGGTKMRSVIVLRVRIMG